MLGLQDHPASASGSPRIFAQSQHKPIDEGFVTPASARLELEPFHPRLFSGSLLLRAIPSVFTDH
jgi:hypothetical protein